MRSKPLLRRELTVHNAWMVRPKCLPWWTSGSVLHLCAKLESDVEVAGNRMAYGFFLGPSCNAPGRFWPTIEFAVGWVSSDMGISGRGILSRTEWRGVQFIRKARKIVAGAKAQPVTEQHNRSPSSATGYRAAQPDPERRNHFPNNIEHLDNQCMGEWAEIRAREGSHADGSLEFGGSDNNNQDGSGTP